MREVAKIKRTEKDVDDSKRYNITLHHSPNMSERDGWSKLLVNINNYFD